MKIPKWAELALSNHRPRAPAWSNDGQPDPVALDRWTIYSQRFRNRWQELDSGQWKVPAGDAGLRDSYNILTIALTCAKRLGNGVDPLKVVKERRALLEVNKEISKKAAELANLFRQRDESESVAGVATWRKDDFGLDPMDLWDALELTFRGMPLISAEFPTENIFNDLIAALNRARTTSLAVPEWPDLLDRLREEECFEPGTISGEFPDITAIGHTTNKTKYSPWCNCLIQMLDDLRLLDCLTNEQLASLAEMAFDAPDTGVINAKQIGALRNRN